MVWVLECYGDEVMEAMNMKLSELKAKMMEFNRRHSIETAAGVKRSADGDVIRMRGHVILKNEVMNCKHATIPEASRTYVFDNYEKALTPGDGGYSIFAYCEADRDCMRIERLRDDLVESAEIDYVNE